MKDLLDHLVKNSQRKKFQHIARRYGIVLSVMPTSKLWEMTSIGTQKKLQVLLQVLFHFTYIVDTIKKAICLKKLGKKALQQILINHSHLFPFPCLI